MRFSFFALALVAFAVAFTGCANDNPVAPGQSSIDLKPAESVDAEINRWVHIYGTVKRADGTLVPNAVVVLSYSYNGSPYQEIARLTSDAAGQFSTDFYSTDGTSIRCQVSGDTEYKQVVGAYMYFAMTYVPGYKGPELPHMP